MNRELEKDNEIVEKILSSKKHLFEEIVDRYKGKVMSTIYRFIGNRHDAEEAAQETFIKAFRYLKSFDLKKNFSSWILKIATNCAYDQLSGIRKRGFESTDEKEPGKGSEPVDSEATPEEAFLESEQNRFLQEAMMKLPDHYREVLVLRFIQDMSYSEISEVLEIPMASVKVNIHRAKARLMKICREMKLNEP